MRIVRDEDRVSGNGGEGELYIEAGVGEDGDRGS